MAGPNGSADAGQIVDIESKEAIALIKGGYATEIKSAVPQKEKPTKEPVKEPEKEQAPDHEKEQEA